MERLLVSKIGKNQTDASNNIKNVQNVNSNITSPKQIDDENQSEGEISINNSNIEDEYDKTMKLPVKQHITKLEVTIFFFNSSY